ncbi:hypothetical protein V2J09_009662 [Rumex salicifolius]
MEKLLCTLFLLLLLSTSGAAHVASNSKPRRLFVFGDSYADTGNIRKSFAYSWKFPYGVTFPGKATGRFSDGRVLTDYVVAPSKTKHGVNFAFGGTGVFDTGVPLPNMTTQIDLFQTMLYGNDVVPLQGGSLNDSVALLSCVGNDYNTFLALGGSFHDLPMFTKKVVKQLASNLRRIRGLGVKKTVVTALQPIGCLPSKTARNWYRECNTTENSAVTLHNLLLQKAVDKLNEEEEEVGPNGGSQIIILDLFNSFMLAMQNKETFPGSVKFEEPLKPCCMGVNENSMCSSLDVNGHKMYTVCNDPKTSFFWDANHPTQAGWEAVYVALQANLQQLLI